MIRKIRASKITAHSYSLLHTDRRFQWQDPSDRSRPTSHSSHRLMVIGSPASLPTALNHHVTPSMILGTTETNAKVCFILFWVRELRPREVRCFAGDSNPGPPAHRTDRPFFICLFFFFLPSLGAGVGGLKRKRGSWLRNFKWKQNGP